MRVLIVTKIFPNGAEPHSSPFNRQQFAALSRLCEVEILATIPWFPGAAHFRRWSAAGRLLNVPARERIDGLDVSHPRFVYIPKIGDTLSGPLYAASLALEVLSKRGSVDLVLGSWAYPDGYAAVVLAELLGVPCVIKVHGSDINVLAQRRSARRRLSWAIPRAERVIAVSRQLANAVAELGIDRARVDVVPNGVDTELFQPRDRAAARQKLGIETSGPGVVYVGRVEPDKGVLDLVRAFDSPRLRGVELWMVGDGSARQECELLARELGVRLSVVGTVAHSMIPEWLAASHVLALPSFAEGMPNVVLEAIACGRRVVATRVGGIPDILVSERLGELVEPRDPRRLGAAIERALSLPDEPESVRQGAVTSWAESARLLYRSLLAATTTRAREAA